MWGTTYITPALIKTAGLTQKLSNYLEAFTRWLIQKVISKRNYKKEELSK